MNTNLLRLGTNVITLITLIIIITACVDEPGKRLRTPTPLIAGIKSYQSFQEIRDHVLQPGVTWKIIWDSKSKAGGNCPRFDELTVSVPFNHLDNQGEVWFQFINNRLFATLFFPNSLSSYLEALSKAGVEVAFKEEIKLPPHTRVWRTTMHNQGFYVGFEDERLDEKIGQYVLKCT